MNLTKFVRPVMLLLLSIILSSASIGGGGQIFVSTLVPYVNSRDWQRTDATVTEVHLIAKKRGGRRVSVRCEVAYTYIVNKHQYKGMKVSVFESDPFGMLEKRLCKRLQMTQKAGKTQQCWYDPNQASSSALDKVFAVELILFALFILTSAGTLGLFGITISVIRLYCTFSIKSTTLPTTENLFAVRIVMVIYWSLLAILSIPLAIENIIQGVLLSFSTMFVGVIYLCGVSSCIYGINRRGRTTGTLLVPCAIRRRTKYVLKIAVTSNEELQLDMVWMKENNVLMWNSTDKAVSLNPVRTRRNECGNELEIEFVPCSLADEIAPDDICALRISETVDENYYQGTFLFGTAADVKEFERSRIRVLTRMGDSNV